MRNIYPDDVICMVLNVTLCAIWYFLFQSCIFRLCIFRQRRLILLFPVLYFPALTFCPCSSRPQITLGPPFSEPAYKLHFQTPHHGALCSVVTEIIRSSAITEGPRDASRQLKSCQLSRNSAETTCTTSPEQIEVMKLEGYSGPMCTKHVHSTMTWSSRFHCPIGVINKPTTDVLWISPVYRPLAVAEFSKSTM